MAAVRRNGKDDESKPRRRPATTLEARENQMIALAVDLAEKQLRDGTASAQVINHFLKLGTSRERLEQEKLEKENELLKSRAEQIASGARMEELYAKAISSMRSYSGQDPIDEYNDED